MKVIVQDKPEQFEAEQFRVNKKPWPHGVEKIGKNQYRFVVNVAVAYKIKDGDWIVYRPGKTDITADEWFRPYSCP